MQPIVKSRNVWDARQGRYVAVTDVISEHGASRIPGFVPGDVAVKIVEQARSTMRRSGFVVVN